MENRSYALVKLQIEFYQTDSVSMGMIFVNRLHPKSEKEYFELWRLQEEPDNDEVFMIYNGFPVKIHIVDEETEEIIHTYNDDVWYDDESSDEYTLLSTQEMNQIFQIDDGMAYLALDENDEMLLIDDFPVVTLV